MNEDDNNRTNTVKLPHFAHIFTQDWSKDNPYDEIESKSIYIGLPQPLHTTPKSLQNDPYTILLNEKRRYVNDVKKCTKYAKNSRIDISSINIHTIKSVVLPKNVWRLACNIKDPDPYFNGDYNWYYTNGVLDWLQVDDSSTKYLIRPDESNSIIITNPLNITENYSIPSQGGTIYGLKSYIIDSKCFVTVRKKFEVELHHFNTIEEGIVPKPIWSLTCMNVPFIDGKIDPNISYNISVLKADHTLKIYDIEANQEILSQNFSNSSQDNFAQIEYCDNNSLILIDRENVKIFDERSSIVTHKINPIECDYLSAITVFDGNIYVTTKHYLFELDKRNFGVLNKTFHLMNGCPFIIKTIESEVGVVMALANDKHRVIVDLNDGLPKEIPNVIDTFNETQLKGNIYLNKNIEAVVSYSTVGMCCNENVIYTCNSYGDVFEQNYSFKEPQLNNTEKFDSWIQNIPYCDAKELYHTGFVDMSRAKFALYSPHDEKIINKMENGSKFKPDLVSYEEGTYARDMEVIWLDEDKSEDLAAPVPEVTSVKKVSEWLTRFTDYDL